ncbi:hypothetical protein ACFY7V_03875 [[Kitasatospora] papulosa]|uniref:hypothetical protein n=1 Tax=Streptomyces TaxID=1883 RepID=UPI002FF393F8
MPAYAPAGAFEAYHARHDDGYAVWVRYVAGDQPVPELPDRMTVRVCRRESGVGIVTVTVSTRCPVCGGPRGFDAIEEYRFREAGAWFTADDWINRCGHIDNAQAVLRESRERPLPAPGRDLTAIDCPVIPEPPAPDSPAGVVLAAAANWRGMRARAAVKLLDESGFSREAELVRAELLVGDSRGYKSAREVAHWLHTGGAS